MSDLKGKLAQKIEKSKEELVSTGGINVMETEAEENGKITKLVPVEANSIERFVPEFAITLIEAKERTRMLQSFIKDMMIPNIDYGIIKGCSKPSLLKSGAEKLCEIFGFSKQIEVLNRVENWDSGFFHYEVKVTLVSKRTGLVEAEGIGSCNTMERKFKTQDSFSVVNTIIKMAKKRALIDAVLSATRSSGIFTQDIEEMNVDVISPTLHFGNIDIKNNIKNVDNATNQISKEQQMEIFSVIRQSKIPMSYAKKLMFKKYNIYESSKLTTEQAEEFIDILKCCQAV
jgi:hypothetical protein